MSDIDAGRLMLPRWRSRASALARGELGAIESGAGDPVVLGQLALMENRFRAERTLESAADLVAFASGWGLKGASSLPEAAALVEKLASRQTVVYRLASEVLGRYFVDEVVDSGIDARIGGLKHRVRTSPRDALSWIELGRCYAALGQRDKARTAVRLAVSLVDSDRYIVRSAARYLCHIGDVDAAEWVLRRATNVRRDPWLLAAHVAVGHYAGRSGGFRKEAKSLVARAGGRVFDESELAAALGSMELQIGNERIGKKLLRASMTKPAENSVAQMAWIERNIVELDIPRGAAAELNSFEAMAWHLAGSGDVAGAIRKCEDWLHDEPFSGGPAVLGSYLGVLSGDDIVGGCSIARLGLRANEGEPMLLNNLAVGLAIMGEVEEARATLKRGRREGVPLFVDITMTATEGLIALRGGDTTLGERRYREAMDRADAAGLRSHRDMVEIHMEIELANLGRDAEPLRRLVERLGMSSDLGLRLAVGRGRALLAKIADGRQQGRGGK